MSDPPVRGTGRPSWLNMRTAGALLIAFMSGTGVLLTWRASIYQGRAGGADHQSILDTVLRRQSEARAELVLEHELEAFATYKVLLTGAAQLTAAAANTPDPPERTRLQESARQNQAEARHRGGAAIDIAYVVADPSSGLPTAYQADARRQALLAFDPERARADPDLTAASADSARSRGERMAAFLPLLVALIGIVTLLQVLPAQRIAPPLVSMVALLWVALLAKAFLGDG